MNKFNSLINLFFGHGNPYQGNKNLWRFILMIIMFSILTYFMPGHFTYGISTGSAFIIYFGSLVYFDKTCLTKSLAISYKKQVMYSYVVIIFFIVVISLIIYILMMIANIAVGKNMYLFTSVNQLVTFVIISLILYLFFVPLCVIMKNWIWNTYFFVSSIVFLVINILIDNVGNENLKLLIAIILLILVTFISFKFSCLFNRPKRYFKRRG